MKILLSILLLSVFSTSLANVQTGSCLTCRINQEIPTVLGAANNINPTALKYALKAYECAVQQGISNRPLLTLIDYSLPSTHKRLWVLDLAHGKVLFNTLVAQGKHTGDLIAHYFSDQPQSKASSIGLFLTEEPYTGHDGYSLRIKGLEKGFNEKAEQRAIVIHGAWYVSDNFIKRMGRIGLSWGCPAVSKEVVKPLIDTIKDGTLVFSYYPDPHYLAQSTFLNCPGSMPSISLNTIPATQKPATSTQKIE